MKRFSFAIVSFLFLAIQVSCGDSTGKSDRSLKTSRPDTVVVDTGLQRRLDTFAHKPRMKGEFGFLVYDLTADKPVYGINEHQAQPTASCMKLLTGVAACRLLGTDYMYRTSLYVRGKVVKDTLRGDVILKAGLDPYLQSDSLKMFAQALKRRHVKAVEGKMILDLVLTEPVRSEEHWYPWDLSFSKYGLLYKGEDKIRQAVKLQFRNQGIQLKDSQIVLGRLYKGDHCIFRYYRTMQRTLQRMWKNSSNTQATSLLYTLGHHVSPQAKDPTKAGVDYLRAFLKDTLQMKDSNLVIHDGCGLCTYNHLSPVALVAILRYGYAHKDIYKMLMRYLAVSGVDGTLRTELSAPALRGQVHGKTGTLSHPYGISSLAGYTKSSNGHILAFAIIDSNMSVLDARVLQKKLCEELVK